MASFANLLGRILLAQLFLLAGLNKIFNYDGTIAYMATQHVSAMLLPLVIALETGGALALLLGWHVRLFAFLLAGFSLLAALVFHHDWSQTSEYLLFISDVAVAGGLLVLAQAGTPGLSLDARRQRRAGRF